MSDYEPYLATLRRVPDDIVLAVASREIEPVEPSSCLCAWVLREYIGRMVNRAADDVDSHGAEAISLMEIGGTTDRCAVAFGGTETEWDNIFHHIVTNPSNVERAFMQRVLECVP